MRWSCLHFSELNTVQLHDIVALRIAVFVVEQNCPYPELDGKDKNSYHVFAENDNGEIVACSRIVPPGMSYPEPSIGRVCSSFEYRGGGLGKELMKRTITFTRELYPGQKIRISAQEYLIRFYQELGFYETGKSYLEDNIPHVEMISSDR